MLGIRLFIHWCLNYKVIEGFPVKNDFSITLKHVLVSELLTMMWHGAITSSKRWWGNCVDILLDWKVPTISDVIHTHVCPSINVEQVTTQQSCTCEPITTCSTLFSNFLIVLDLWILLMPTSIMTLQTLKYTARDTYNCYMRETQRRSARHDISKCTTQPPVPKLSVLYYVYDFTLTRIRWMRLSSV